jgi:hypothetical protein
MATRLGPAGVATTVKLVRLTQRMGKIILQHVIVSGKDGKNQGLNLVGYTVGLIRVGARRVNFKNSDFVGHVSQIRGDIRMGDT